MKSSYLNKEFSDYWNERAGENGEVYKKHILDPIMFELMGSIKDKTILELGCGNGYLAKKFIEGYARTIYLMDISTHNINHTKNKVKDKNVEFIVHDATTPWNIKHNSVDLIYSNMMLNEVENISTPISEAYKILKDNGKFIFSVTHPSWDLFVFAQETAGKNNSKILGLKGYFDRLYAKYVMGKSSINNPELYSKKEFLVDHFHRPLQDYSDTILESGFKLERIIEPELTDDFLKQFPRFEKSKVHPIGLIFYCIKPSAN